MNKGLRNGIIIGSLSLALISIVAYFKKQYDLLINACYTISGGIIHTLGLDNVRITLFFKVVNESDLTIQISDMDFNIYVNNMFVTRIKKNEKQTLYNKSEAIIKLEFEFNPRDLLRAGITNIQPILQDKEKLVITTKGSFSAKAGILNLKKVPFEENITLKELLTPNPDAKKC